MPFRPRLSYFSYRFAEQVLNAKLAQKQEIERLLLRGAADPSVLSRPGLNAMLDNAFVEAGWQRQPSVFGDDVDASAKMDFLKDRVGVEVGLGHASFLGIDLLKFQVASYSAQDRIDVGVYVATTRTFQTVVTKEHQQNWEGSLTFEKICRCLPLFKSAIQVPIYVIGIDC